MLVILRGILIFITIIFSKIAYCQEQKYSSFDLEPIIVKKDVDNSFLKTYCLKGDTLEDLPFDSFAEKSEVLPLDLQSRSIIGGIQTDFSLRASNFSGVAVLFGDTCINDPQTAHHNSDIPLTKYDIEYISVVPQLSPVWCGPNAIAGAIQIIPKKPHQREAILEYSLGSFQTHTAQMSFSNKIKDMGFRLSLERQQSDGFYEDTDFKKDIGSLAFSWGKDEVDLVTFFGYQQKTFGAYDFYTPKRGFLSQEWTKTYLFNTDLKISRDNLILRPIFLWRRHYDKFILDKTQKRSKYLNHHRTDIYTPRVCLKQELYNLGRLGLGIESNQEEIKSSNLGKHIRSYQSILWDYEKELSGKIFFALAQRLDFFEDFKDSSCGSINTIYHISDKSSFNLSIANSLRLPSFTELYYQDPTTEGNQNLEKEKAVNYQLGYNYKDKPIETGLILFFRQERKLIDWLKQDPKQTKWQAENIPGAEIKGIENYFNWQMTPLALNLNYTYADKRLNDLGWLYKYGPNYSRHIFNTLIKLDLKFGKQSLVLTYKKKPLRDGWFILNTHFSYNLNKSSQIFLDIRNLLNVEYQEIEGIPQPPRYIELGFQLDW